MRRMAVLAVLIALLSVSAAQPIGNESLKVPINETNYEEVKSKIVETLNERINKLTELRDDIKRANSTEELREVLEKQKFEIDKIKAIKSIDLAIRKLEGVNDSIKSAISELKSLKEKAKNANNTEELRETMKEVKEVVIDLNKEFKNLKHKRPIW